MNRVVFVFFLTCILLGISTNKNLSDIKNFSNYTKTTTQSLLVNNKINHNLKKLDTEKYNIDEGQSFETSFEGWGRAKFVSTDAMIEETPGNYFFLLDEQNYILYSFPKFYGNNWSGRNGLAAVAFKDVNKDGLKDVIIIAYVDAGAGPSIIEPFPIAGIYFQKENKTFTTLPELDQAINDKGHNQTIKDIIQYVSKQRINVR
ncbi:hypothetical protein [Paenibacillus polymyxa]|uniref:hypothetical protein n=1 Tax=Paenibacillus TaxID=44249 RepID=UPI000737D60D|nr:hypothetical protein [Paenibacillus polymyxa]